MTLSLSQSRIAVTWMTFSDGATAFGGSIVDVVLLRAEPQMVGTNAEWDIANVEHHQPIGDRPVCEFPRHSMGALGGTLDDRTAVATTLGTRPQPALAGLVHPIPEGHGTLSHVHNFTSRAA